MKKVKKALIPAAGLGTRFLPATKSVPKEMLTIVDAPIIFYVVEEAIKAGIEDIVLIAGRGKHAIEDFFDTSYEVEDKLLKDGKIDMLNRLEKIRDMANIISVRQKQALGLGHAVYSGKRIIGDEPFAVLLGDEITVDSDTHSSATEDLVQAFEKTGQSGLSVMKVADDQVSKYGIAEFTSDKMETLSVGSGRDLNYFRAKKLLEKPQPSETTSRWAITGRYIFDQKIFSILENQKPTKNNEIQLTDAIQELTRNDIVNGYPLQGRRYDAGDKLGYLVTNIEFALRNKELTTDLAAYLKSLVHDLEKGSFK
jgi:UTP--glucose-1-phosphate uridylyltransferase